MDNDSVIGSHLQWLALKGRQPETVKGRAGTLRRLAAHIGVPLLDATESDLLAWRVSMSGLADATVISAVGHARGFYRWAYDTGLRPDRPARMIPVPPMPDYEPRPVGEDDLMAAVDGAPPRIRAWLVLAAWGGLRACEIAPLRRGCVRENDQPPHVVIRKDATKGKRKGRVVYLSPLAAAELASLLPAGGMWCFPRLDGGTGHVTAHLVSNLANEYLHDAGIADTFHSFRHRYATELLDQTGDPVLVQDQLGHADIAMVALYAKVSQQRAAAAAAALPFPQALRKAG